MNSNQQSAREGQCAPLRGKKHKKKPACSSQTNEFGRAGDKRRIQ